MKKVFFVPPYCRGMVDSTPDAEAPNTHGKLSLVPGLVSETGGKDVIQGTLHSSVKPFPLAQASRGGRTGPKKVANFWQSES